MEKTKFTIYYFAYGSNLDVERLKERRFEFSERIPAKLNGYKLTFDKISSRNPNERFANIQVDKNSIVEGAVYIAKEEFISILDKYEGYPDNYIREEVEVILKNAKEKVKALVYIAIPEKVSKGKPSKDYLKHILAGKDVFSNEYYKKLCDVETI